MHRIWARKTPSEHCNCYQIVLSCNNEPSNSNGIPSEQRGWGKWFGVTNSRQFCLNGRWGSDFIHEKLLTYWIWLSLEHSTRPRFGSLECDNGSESEVVWKWCLFYATDFVREGTEVRLHGWNISTQGTCVSTSDEIFLRTVSLVVYGKQVIIQAGVITMKVLSVTLVSIAEVNGGP